MDNEVTWNLVEDADGVAYVAAEIDGMITCYLDENALEQLLEAVRGHKRTLH